MKNTTDQIVKEDKARSGVEPREVKISIDVIATYETEDQEFFEFNLNLERFFDDTETIDRFGLEGFVLKEVIKRLKGNRANLIKLSLAAETNTKRAWNLVSFLERTNGKYYFQPNQRDEFEESLCERYLIASETEDFYESCSPLKELK